MATTDTEPTEDVRRCRWCDEPMGDHFFDGALTRGGAVCPRPMLHAVGRCPLACPHGDRCTLRAGHEGGCNHRVCDCNEPNCVTPGDG